MSDKVEEKDGFKIRKSVDFKTDMINTQQEALVKTVHRYEERDNPVEQFLESAAARTVDAFLRLNEQIVKAIPEETRLQLQEAWHNFLLAF